MHTRTTRLGFTAWTLLIALQAPAWGQATAPALAQEQPATVVAAVPDPYSWRGHEGEIESFLREGTITHFKDIPVGITKPQRGYFAPGGPATSMAWKPLQDQVMHGKMESYRSEIAAYLLSRHLGLDMVPPVVEREIKGVKGAACSGSTASSPGIPRRRRSSQARTGRARPAACSCSTS